MAGVHKLKAKQCEAAAPKEKIYRLSDGGGLFLAVMPNGARYWQLRYRFGGAERLFQVGSFSRYGAPGSAPLTLEQARAETAKWREVVRQGRDPVNERRLQAAQAVAERNWTFEKASQAWVEHNRSDWSAAHLERNEGLLRRVLYPRLRELPISRIPSAIVLESLKDAVSRGTVESARRARGIAEQVFAHAIVCNQATENPARDLAKAIRKPPVQHFAALSRDEIGPLLNALDDSGLDPQVNAALRLMLYTGLRDHELRAAKWSEMDLDGAVWNVPAVRMKRRKPHSVPLPAQALAVLEGLSPLTNKGPDSYVFASRGKTGYLAENTLRLALHRLGFKVTAHGIRSLLTDTLNELGFRHDWVETQMHHAINNKTTAAYKRTQFLEQRAKMMAVFADYCDARKAGKSHDEAAGDESNVLRLNRIAA